MIAGKLYGVYGTSCSAPAVGGLFTLVNAQRLKVGKSPLGFVNPLLYSGYKSFTNDITDGFNNCAAGFVNITCCTQGYHATPGWDPTSGIICVVIFLYLCLIGCSLRFTCRGFDTPHLTKSTSSSDFYISI
jgi:subtilase family serine protease